MLLSAVATLLLASGAVVALPSQKPDDTPMIDSRVRAIELKPMLPSATPMAIRAVMPPTRPDELAQNPGRERPKNVADQNGASQESALPRPPWKSNRHCGRAIGSLSNVCKTVIPFHSSACP